MSETLMGVCQHCGRRLEFAAGQSGQWAVCANCGKSTRLKPAPVELLEAAPAADAAAPAPAGAGAEVDDTERQLRRKYLKLVVVTLILAGILAGLVAVAEWLRGLQRP